MKVLLAVGAVALVLAGWYVGPLVHSSTSATSTPPPRSRFITSIGPIAYTARKLTAESVFLNTPIFWAGPQTGYRYEFRRTPNGYLFVRYLPPGVRRGADGAEFLVVASYPFPGAYASLRRVGRGRALACPGGSILVVRPTDPKTVLMAYPGINYEIEVYDPRPAVAIAIARSGQVRPVA